MKVVYVICDEAQMKIVSTYAAVPPKVQLAASNRERWLRHRESVRRWAIPSVGASTEEDYADRGQAVRDYVTSLTELEKLILITEGTLQL